MGINGDKKSSGEATFVCFIESAVLKRSRSIKYPTAILCNNNEAKSERRINLKLYDLAFALHHFDMKVSIARVHSIPSELLPLGVLCLTDAP
jgi:hypothetical protein